MAISEFEIKRCERELEKFMLKKGRPHTFVPSLISGTG